MAPVPKDQKVEYNYLGRSGVKVANLCLGAMTFGESQLPGQCDEALSHQILQRYAEWGGNFVDTANVYGRGNSERIIGTWLERQTRDNFFIATKVRANMGTDENVNNIGLSRRHITASIDNSLSRLRTNYVDLYQTHIWDEATPLEETVRTLDDLVRCGKVRYLGASNLTGWQVQKLVDTCEKLGTNPFISLQQQYSLVSRFSETEPFQVCKEQGIGVLPWSPLKGGLLTGKYKRDMAPSDGRLGWVAEDEARGTQASPAWSGITKQDFDIVEAAAAIAKTKGRSPAQVAIRWLLQKDVVSSVVLGARKLEQLDDNMAASTGWSLTDEEMKTLDDISTPTMPYPYEMVFRINLNRKNRFAVPQHVKSI